MRLIASLLLAASLLAAAPSKADVPERCFAQQCSVMKHQDLFWPEIHGMAGS